MTQLGVETLVTLLQVYDIQASIDFYEGLGFRVLNQSEGEKITWVLLGMDQLRLMLNTLYEEGEQPVTREHERQRIHSDTGLFFNCENVDSIHQYLVKKGIESENPVVREYGMRQLYLKDPDGYTICYQSTV